MELALGLFKRLLLLTVPIATTSIIVSPAGHAATFSFSRSITTLDRFSSPGFNLDTSTQTNTLAIASDSGSVVAVARAVARLTPKAGSNLSISQANGDGAGYLGVAESRARVVGNFLVDANQRFSFNFFSQLALITAIDDPQLEEAVSFANIQYNLFDNSTGDLLDSFGLFGQLSSSDTFSLPVLSLSDFLRPTSALISFDSDGNQSIVLAQLAGSYSRTFNSLTSLRLEEFKQNGAAVVAVPVPGLLPGLIISLISFCRLKRQRTKLAEPAAEYAVEKRS